VWRAVRNTALPWDPQVRECSATDRAAGNRDVTGLAMSDSELKLTIQRTCRMIIALVWLSPEGRQNDEWKPPTSPPANYAVQYRHPPISRLNRVRQTAKVRVDKRFGQRRSPIGTGRPRRSVS